MSATSNDFSFCWDRVAKQYQWGCGVQDLLCNAWNIVVDELSHGNNHAGHISHYIGRASHGSGSLNGRLNGSAALLNCSQYDHTYPLPLPT
jgi:hypothetical protein